MTNRRQKNKPIINQENQHPGRFIAQQTTVYRGQLPPPEMLERFEGIHPGFTDRLLKLVEEESAFKRTHDSDMFKSFRFSTILGIVCAFLSVVVIASVAIYAIYKGSAQSAAYIMGTCVVGVIIAFLQRKKLIKEDNK